MGDFHLICHQIKTLLYRNFLLKWRLRGVTLQEVLWPIYFVVLLVILKITAYKPTSFPAEAKAEVFSLYNASIIPPDVTLLYEPNGTDQIAIVDQIKALNSAAFATLTTAGYASNEEMLTAYKGMDSGLVIFGVSFVDGTYEYTLRASKEQIPAAMQPYSGQTDCRLENGCPATQYFKTGFTTMQVLIDTALARGFAPTFPLPAVTVQEMPIDGTITNAQAFQFVSTIYLVMSMSFFMIFLLVFIVTEKERKIKDGMQMMGLRNISLWMAWFLTYLIIIFVMTLVMSIICVFGQLYPNSDFFLIFLLFFLYGVSIEVFAFMLTPFFSKARSAGAFGSFITLIVSLLYLLVIYVPVDDTGIYFLSLISPAGFAIGLNQVAILELGAGGAKFSNMDSGQYSVSITLIMLSVDIVIYGLLTLYFDSVVPGEYGRKEKPWFFILPSFWCGTRGSDSAVRHTIMSNCETELGEIENENVEQLTEEYKGRKAIRIQNLNKTFYAESFLSTDKSRPTHAVQNFSLDIYEGQITALLGHNGAGKTTIFNILTGFVEATSGSATVYGYDISNTDDIQRVRQMTGVCPQYNLHFDELSVKENLEIFAGIKNIPASQWDSEISRIVQLVDLEDQLHSISKTLSGGQKRKLSVGIAIMGDPKILVLDEPTAGMDPLSRRKLWNVLRQRREGKVTILTTHFMDEADILSDRKAIISKGKLRCVGSSLFLKNRFGVGYHLSVVTEDGADRDRITSSVANYVTGYEVHRESGQEIEYTMPISQVENFSGLFTHFEEDGKRLGVKSFGVSMTTLEEVFLKIGEEDEEHEKEAETEDPPNDEEYSGAKYTNGKGVTNSTHDIADENMVSIEINKSVFDPNTSEMSEKSSFKIWKALAYKNMLVYIRNGAFIIFGFFFPIALAVGSASLLNIQGPTDDSSDPSKYLFQPDNYPSVFLYKNSTGAPMDDMLSYVDGVWVESDLNDLLRKEPRVLFASDIQAYETANVNYRAFYNTTAVHSLPIIINSMSQATISLLSSTKQSLVAYAQRWPSEGNGANFDVASFGGALMGGLAMVMSTGIGCINPIKEREMKIRGQLRISGVSFSLYWLAAFTVDYAWYFVTALAYIVSLAGFQVSSFSSAGAVGAMIILCIGWGISGILTSYCGSFLYDKFETAQSTWSILLQMTALIPYTIVSVLDQLGSPDTAVILNIVFSVIDPYYAGFGGFYYITKAYADYFSNNRGATSVPAHVYFDWTYPMIPFSLLIVYIQAFLLVFALQIIDILKNGGKWRDALPFISKPKSVEVAPSSDENEVLDEEVDDDVMEEKLRVKRMIEAGEMTGNSDKRPVILVEDLKKEFVKRGGGKKNNKGKKEPTKKTVVNDLSLSVVEGEVLGLLGPNGAGKTTTINMITAEVEPTRGKILVSGYDVQSNVSGAFQNMGYCSQDNPIWDNLTIREHLHIYALSHGVTPNTMEATIDSYIDALGIREHEHKRGKALSGGTKRKLCFAISMLGNPQVVLLDEPSTGMDPKTKRFMWDTIGRAFAGTNRGAILTTHYMDEADALCNRIAIMVMGKLKCIGSTQHLKNKFGQGYVLEVKLRQANLYESTTDGKLPQFIERLFGKDVEEPETFGNRFIYKISRNHVTGLSRVFSELEQNKTELSIEEYSFSQSTLEQVFVRFAKEQDDSKEESD